MRKFYRSGKSFVFLSNHIHFMCLVFAGHNDILILICSLVCVEIQKIGWHVIRHKASVTVQFNFLA